MAFATLKRARSALVLMAAFALMLASLYLMSEVTQKSEQFEEWYSTLLIVNALGLALLVAVTGYHLWRLVRQFRHGIAGSRLTLRLVILFVALSIAPVSVVFYFSLQFLHRGIDSWFDVRIEQALDDALELSRTSLDARKSELLNHTLNMAEDLVDVMDIDAAPELDELRSRAGVEELTLLTENGRVIASSSIDPADLLPNRPNEPILLQLRQGGNYIGLDPIGDSGLYVRVVVSVTTDDPTVERRILQSLSPVAERQSQLADSVQLAFSQYKKLAYLRNPLIYSFTLILSLVLAFSLLTAVWAAVSATRRLVAPIRDLAEGTRAVAAGDYDKRLPIAAKDELGFLVESFNDMTHKIALARDQARRSQQQVEGQRAYLETLLGRLSSGVLTLDKQYTLRTANVAAGLILGAELAYDDSLDEICAEYPHLLQFTQMLRAHLAGQSVEWREEFALAGLSGRQILLCRGTPLPNADGLRAEYLVVFDDVTTLVQAQRNAAWGEVARRLAHEFKNPLTPIQLSAERLRHKYLKTMDAKDAEVLDRSTHTIVQQVEVMRDMVNAFAEYARNPQMQPRLLDLNGLINEVLDLYRGNRGDEQFQLHLNAELPSIEADPGRLRQLLHNLIKNSLEAMAGERGARVITVSTSCEPATSGTGCVVLRVQDRGPGIPVDILAHLFEPYVTTKPKGTGLGLAIVKKIVEEHGGSLTAENLAQGGAAIIIRLPVPSHPQSAPRLAQGASA